MTKPQPAPYANDAANVLYNLLFCDEPALFAAGAKDPASDIAIVLSGVSRQVDVRRIADDATAEGRVRMLACGWLRRHGLTVAPKRLFGVIVEVPLDGGLDTLAAFSDGGVRYINQTGTMSVFETAPPAMKPVLAILFAAAQAVVDRNVPSDKPRRPPPPPGALRMTLLVSDGSYFGEGRFADLERDALAGPVVNAATQLLMLVTGIPAP